MVDRFPRVVILDQLLLNRPQRQRAELDGRLPAIQLIYDGQRPPDDGQLAGRPSVFDVVPFGEVQVRRSKFNHGYLDSRSRGWGNRHRNGLRRDLGHKPSVRFLAGRRIVLAEVEAAPLNLHECLASALVVTVLWNWSGS
jgi:hypothetical protein